MYEYTPKSEKKLEKICFAGSVVLAVLLFAGSKLPGMPYPVILQSLSFAVIAFAIFIIAKFLVTSYTYCVEMGERGETELRITQHTGRHTVVVCRIPLSSVTQRTVLTKENKKALYAARRSKMIYRYVGEMSVERALLLDVSFGGEEFGLVILTDNTLFDILTKF